MLPSVGLVVGLMLGLPWACRPLIFFKNLWACLLFYYKIFFFLGLKVRTNKFLFYFILFKGVPNLMEGVPNFFFLRINK